MNNIYQKAIDAEKNGDYSAAAKLYALYAFDVLADSEYISNQGMRLGVTHMLESISADVRGDNSHRARIQYRMMEPVYEELFRQTDESVVKGLLHEWKGDAEWMLRNEMAREHYQSALQLYDDISLSEQMFWGAEPEYDNAYGAMSGFLTAMGESYPESHSMEFKKRVQFKLELIDKKSV